MRRTSHIAIISLLFLACAGGWLFAMPDDYVDDVYYSEQVELQQQLQNGDIQPYYNKKQMQEVVFYQDSVPSAPVDTLSH